MRVRQGEGWALPGGCGGLRVRPSLNGGGLLAHDGGVKAGWQCLSDGRGPGAGGVVGGTAAVPAGWGGVLGGLSRI